MKSSYKSRILKLEKDLQHYRDEKKPNYAFSIQKTNISDEEIIKALNEGYGLEITKKQYNKWIKIRHDSGRLTILSPNFNIDKYMQQRRKNINNTD